MIALSGKFEASSSAFWIILQLSRISLLILRFLGLKVVTMTGLSMSAFFSDLSGYPLLR